MKALNYYLSFSNPTLPTYTYNSGLSNSRDLFVSGKLAMYIGHASELFSLQEQNPNFSYDVVSIPQFKDSQTFITYTDMLSAVIMKSSKDPSLSFSVLTTMAGADFEAKIANAISLPPPRRDLLTQKPSSSYVQTFYNSALISRGWNDPEPIRTNEMIKDAIENVSSGRFDVSESVTDLCSKLDSLIAESFHG